MPSDISESDVVSKAFLEEALGRKIESFTVKAGTEAGDNYMSILYAFDIKVLSRDSENGETEETLHLLSKCYPANPARQTFLNKQNIFWRELFIYEKWVPMLLELQKNAGLKEIVKPAIPPFISGHAIDFNSVKDENGNIGDKVYKPLDIYIMMEDLRTQGYKMANRLIGFDRDHAALGFTALAEMHALSWIYKQKHNLKNIYDKHPALEYDFSDEDDKKMWIMMMENSIKSTLEVVSTTVGEDSPIYRSTEDFKKIAITMEVSDVFFGMGDLEEKDLDNFMRIKPSKVAEVNTETPWRLVIHGDCWINNMLFRYDEETGKPEKVILVDLQMCRDACPTTDLAYMIFTSTDAEFRKNHLDSMLQIYTDRFNYVCKLMNTETLPGFCFQELKRRFHRAKLFGLMMSVFCLPIMLKDKENVADLENMKGEIEDIFLSMGEGSNQNERYNKRMMEVIQELYDEGVI